MTRRIHTLLSAVALVAFSLAMVGCEPSKPAAKSGFVLHVSTSPSGAEVFVEGNAVGLTPMEAQLDSGAHMVEIRKDGYLSQWVPIRKGQTTDMTLDLPLEPIVATVVIDSKPAGALVKLDGDSVGQTPLTVREVAVGTHKLKLSLGGHAEAEHEFTVSSARPLQVSVPMASLLGTLSIYTATPECQVFLDNEPVGDTPPDPRSPLVIKEVLEGNHTIRISKANYEDLVQTIVLERRENKELTIPALREQPGNVVIRTSPAGAKVYLQTQMLGATPLTLDKLEPGDYVYRIDLTGYAPTTVKATVSPGLTKYIDVDLDKEAATLQLTTEPAGCTVTLGSTRIGTTMRGTSPEVSKVLTYDGIAAGDYILTVEHPEYERMSRRVVFARGETLSERVALVPRFIPTHRITITGGRTYDGMLVRRLPDGSVEFRYKIGETVTVTVFKKDEVLNLNRL